MGKTKLGYSIVYIIMCIPLLIMPGCNKYDEIIFENSGENISFKALLAGDTPSLTKGSSTNLTYQIEDWVLECNTATSKATPVTSLSGNAGVIGFVKSEDSWGNVPIEYMSNALFTFDGDGMVSENAISWNSIKDFNSLSVFAYSPKDVASNITYSANNASFVYTVPDNVSEQVDIIAAKVQVQVKKDKNPPVPLNFNHALTAVRFKTDEADVKCVKISGVNNKGIYNIGTGWSGQEGTAAYEITTADLNKNEFTLILIPQTLPDGATVTLEFTKESNKSPITASIAGKVWSPGKMITYTLTSKKENRRKYVYLDLAAGNIKIENNHYTGYVFINKGDDPELIEGDLEDGQEYYIYQSCITDINNSDSGVNKARNYKVGWSEYDEASKQGKGEITLPSYPPVKYNNQLWGDYITNNTNVKDVIENWDNAAGAGEATETNAFAKDPNQPGAQGAVRNSGREATKNRIHITGNTGEIRMIIDNLYSSYQERGSTPVRTRTTGGISFLPKQDNASNSVLTIHFIGDNRFGCINYQNYKNSKLNCLKFEGSGTLTVGDTDYYIDGSKLGSNRSCSVIGGKDEKKAEEDVYNIEFNSGIVYAGAVPSGCTAIGGGGNGNTSIVINGGTITAVAASTGTAIGGGTGLKQPGGEGYITINGGNIYAYNYKNSSNVPSSAIGAAGSSTAVGGNGTVYITGGYVYAYSEFGTAIGGGSSAYRYGGKGTINISGGTVIAKSGDRNSAGIGGGCSRAVGWDEQYKTDPLNGGDAVINISGNPILRTGSIGGGTPGKGEDKGGKIGYAKITVAGGDIQAQFVMADSPENTFNMGGGLIRNSNTSDNEYFCIQQNGGAVYMEKGKFTMTGGTIENCSAQNGGAVYIKGSSTTASFTMSKGEIKNCISENSGGAVYLDGGNVSIEGSASINHNIARNGNGGGVCINNGNLTMKGGAVYSNSAFAIDNIQNGGSSKNYGKGGGVYISSSERVDVNLLDGEILTNTSALLGGGICVEMPDGTSAEAHIVVGKENYPEYKYPIVKDNHTLIQGGGLYVSGQKSNMIIHSGTILQNTTSGYVANPNVVNEGGSVTLLSKNATTSVRLTFDPNGGLVNGTYSEVESHLIVSATNSIVKTERAYNRDGYNLVGWHTRKDGNDAKGRRFYIVNGTVTVNTDSDITLYALWEKQN